MSARYFTVAEANGVLPQLLPLLGRLIEYRARIVSLRSELQPMLTDHHNNVGSPIASSVAHDMLRIEQLLQQIEQYGCYIKDPNVGLIDFLTRINGKECLLCWRYGEPPYIQYYHQLHDGFAGRTPIPPTLAT